MRKILSLLTLVMLLSLTLGAVSAQEEELVGYEILQIVSPNERRSPGMMVLPHLMDVVGEPLASHQNSEMGCMGFGKRYLIPPIDDPF